MPNVEATLSKCEHVTSNHLHFLNLQGVVVVAVVLVVVVVAVVLVMGAVVADHHCHHHHQQSWIMHNDDGRLWASIPSIVIHILYGRM